MNKDIVVIAVDVGKLNKDKKSKTIAGQMDWALVEVCWSKEDSDFIIKKSLLGAEIMLENYRRNIEFHVKKGARKKWYGILEFKNVSIARMFLERLASEISRALRNGKQVAVGMEMPLFIPLKCGLPLTNARIGEGNKAWSASSSPLFGGLPFPFWLFQQIKEKVRTIAIKPTYNWEDFIRQRANLLIWEAFVSKDGASPQHINCTRKTNCFCKELMRLHRFDHTCDAYAAVCAFIECLRRAQGNGTSPSSAVKSEFLTFNLAGAALLWSGLLDEEIQRVGWECVKKKYLYTPCLVVKTAKPEC